MNDRRYPLTYDLTNCDAEPLRFIRSCQQHACMVVVYLPGLTVKAFSANCTDHFPDSPGIAPGQPLDEILSLDTMNELKAVLESQEFDGFIPLVRSYEDADGRAQAQNILVHRNGDLLFLEFEQRNNEVSRESFLRRIDQTLQRIQAAREQEEILRVTVEEVKKLTAFDRVMLYKFDEEYNGTVVAEAREEELEPFINLRYPHTDIPKQARELYLRQQVRHIVDTAEGSYSLLVSDSDQPVDLGDTANRAVSPIHLEYLRNMGVGASISIAIILSGQLWGLIACHHRQPKLIDCRLRSMLRFFGRVVSGHLALQQSIAFRMEVLQTNVLRAKLLERMSASSDVRAALLGGEGELLDLVNASGVVLLLEGEMYQQGKCPQMNELVQIIEFLNEKDKKIYDTHELFTELPGSADFLNKPAGLLALRISAAPAEYLIWFRPEVVETVNWGGRPTARKIIAEGRVRLHPELSFNKWAQTVEGLAKPWEQYQIDAANNLRNDIKDIILQRFQELKDLNEQLVSAYEQLESFSYTVSHDLRAPLRSIKGYAEILQEDYNQILDEYGQNALKVIVANIDRMNEFINDILEFSRVGNSQMTIGSVFLTELIDNLWQDIRNPGDRPVRLELNLLTDLVPGDFTSIKQLLLNLLGNSVKYARDIPDSWVRVSSYTADGFVHVEVSDNGIGFDMKYADRIFAVFNRLVADEDYEGTGIGLSLVKRIVERHLGKISVDSKPAEGTTFFLQFPTNLAEKLS